MVTSEDTDSIAMMIAFAVCVSGIVSVG
jgi:hypothetical protein